jgi:hypothetical protein
MHADQSGHGATTDVLLQTLSTCLSNDDAERPNQRALDLDAAAAGVADYAHSARSFQELAHSVVAADDLGLGVGAADAGQAPVAAKEELGVHSTAPMTEPGLLVRLGLQAPPVRLTPMNASEHEAANEEEELRAA